MPGPTTPRSRLATRLAGALATVGLAGACNTNPAPAPAPPASSTRAQAFDAEVLLSGGPALQAKLRAAIAAKGPGYQARTKHKDAAGKPKHVNRLILESSPYLLQHAHNPVNWFPWGDEAFEVARKLGRPVFLSVGYSTCHWCHVMEEESFEDPQVAAYLNKHYVAIKVDREERPDVDAIYMRAVQILTRRGGWPMSVWLTGDRKPFYGGTYFPARDGDRGRQKGFLTLLAEQAQAYSLHRGTVVSDAARLGERIADGMKPPEAGASPGPAALAQAVKIAKRRFDADNGGAKGRPKFPSGFPIRLLMRWAKRAGDDEAKTMALTTLRKMAAGGMYDHVGGGFHRYSTDARWLVPHFEKMLYDNALLAVAYLEGYQLSGDPELARVARETLDYVARDMTSPEGAFYSATDADSIGPGGHREEGYYFTWTPAEIDALLTPDEAAAVKALYPVTARGNFEKRNILHTPKPRIDVAKHLKLDDATFAARIDAARTKLRKAREKRPAPIRDEKIQVDWNGLMIAAMARGARVLGEPRYAQVAAKAATFLANNLMKGGRLRHSFKDGRHGAIAFAADHAFLASGLIELFEATSDPRFLDAAVARMNALEKHHRAEAGAYYRSADDAEKLLARQLVQRDGATPSENSIALMNHLKLHTLTTKDVWRKRAKKTLEAFATTILDRPWAVDEMMLAVDFHDDAAKEVVLVLPTGDDADPKAAEALLAVARGTFVPNQVFVAVRGSQAPGALSKGVPWTAHKPPRGGKPTAYVCEEGVCDLPTGDPKVFRKQITKSTPYAAPVGGASP